MQEETVRLETEFFVGPGKTNETHTHTHTDLHQCYSSKL